MNKFICEKMNTMSTVWQLYIGFLRSLYDFIAVLIGPDPD